MGSLMSKKLKFFYAAGPGDVIGTYSYWKRGDDDPTLLGYTDSGLFYDLVKELDAEALVIASHSKALEIHDAPFTISHLPKKKAAGLFYHLNHFYYGCRIALKALMYRPHVAIIEDGTSYWFIWNVLHAANIAVVPTFRCALWPPFKPIQWKQRFLNFLDRGFFQKRALAVLPISDLIGKQIEMLTENKAPPLFKHVPLYKSSVFENLTPPDLSKTPFRVLFIGRIEREKGVFDLLEIAECFKKQGILSIHFDFCGSGSAEKEFIKQIKENDLTEICHFHGYCNRSKLLKILGESHIIAAPSQNSEGFCMVVAEGTMAGRPVVTSRICPALENVKKAAVEAEPENTTSYAEAIFRLYKDKDFYNQKQSACEAVSSQFYDSSKSWKAALYAAVGLLDNKLKK